MTADQKRRVAAWLNAVEFVVWDRLVDSSTDDRLLVIAYGWIGRRKAGADFVVFRFDGDSIEYTTSSAERSREIGRILGHVEGGHVDCEPVEDVLGSEALGYDAVANRVVRVRFMTTTGRAERPARGETDG